MRTSVVSVRLDVRDLATLMQLYRETPFRGKGEVIRFAVEDFLTLLELTKNVKRVQSTTEALTYARDRFGIDLRGKQRRGEKALTRQILTEGGGVDYEHKPPLHFKLPFPERVKELLGKEKV